MTTLHPYEQGYLAGQRHKESGGTLYAGNFDHSIGTPYDQGYVDGFYQKQGRISDEDSA